MGKEVMASDGDIQEVLDKVELIKKRMKIVQVEEHDRKRRNLQSDEILSRFSEPEMRQQWRIYKMVEDQCSRIEDEVRIEVERKMRLKRMRLREAHHPTELIKHVGRIKKDVKVTTKPRIANADVAIDVQSRPSKTYQDPSSQPLRSGEPIQKTVKLPVQSQVPKKEPIRSKAPWRADESVPQGPSLPSKNIPKVKKQFLSPTLASNVKLVHVTHHQPPRQPITLLSGHVYPGVDIPPSQIQHKPTPPILIIKDDTVEIPSISRASSHSQNDDDEGSRHVPGLTITSLGTDVPYKPKKAEQNEQSKDNMNGSRKCDLNYSENKESMEAEENYEQDDDHDEEEQEQDGEDTLGTDRLSTIPEDTEGKVVASSSDTPDVPYSEEKNATTPGPNQPPQPSPVRSDCSEGPQSFIFGFHSPDITLKEGVLSESDESDLSPRGKPDFIPESLVISPEKFPVHFETDPDSCKISVEVPPLKELAKFALNQTQSSLNLSLKNPSAGLNIIASKSFQTEATQTSLPSISLDSGTLAETTMEEIEQDVPTKASSSSMPSTETELSEGQLLVSFSTLLSDGEVSPAEVSNMGSNIHEPRSSKSTSEGEMLFPHPTSS